MKPPLLGSLNADLPALARDVSERVHAIFEGCPHLAGFTIQDVNALPEPLRPQGVDEGLVVTDLAIYPLVSSEQRQAIGESLSLALLELVCDRPAARNFLPGRTFARALH
jgi:hypothetical protein